MMGVAFTICLGYLFNHSIIDNLFHANAAIVISFIFASLLMLFANIKYIKTSKSLGARLLILFLLSAIVLLRNKDLFNERLMPPFFSVFALYMIFILSFTDKWCETARKVLLFFTFENVLATLFCFAFRDFYAANIMPIFQNTQIELTRQFNKIQIAGFAQHYSTNALYLVSGIFTLLLSINKNKNKNVYKVLLVLNIIALLLTGKRAQVVFLIIATLAIMIIKYRQRIHEAIKKAIAWTVVAIATIVVLTSFIPTISNSFIRAYESIGNEDSMYTRNILYDVAESEFFSHSIFGIGWGGYKYTYYATVPSILKERDYMQAHCIYLQLLCETGLVGTIIICSAFIYVIYLALKIFLRNEKSKPQKAQKALIILMFTIYFLLEGAIGNSIYDMQIYIPFALFVAMLFSMKNNDASLLAEANRE